MLVIYVHQRRLKQPISYIASLGFLARKILCIAADIHTHGREREREAV